MRTQYRIWRTFGSLMFCRRFPARQSQPAACACLQNRAFSANAEPLPEPHIEGTEKEFTPKLHDIVDRISSLTLMEVADLNELLKKKLNITETPMMAMGPVMGGQTQTAEEDESASVKVEQSTFTVTLTKFDESKKVAMIKEIKSQVEGMNLVQAKKFVEGVPQDVKVDISKEDAEKLKAVLEAVGGTVEIS